MIIGAVVVAVSYIKAWLAMSGSSVGALFTLVELAAVVYCIYRFSKERSLLYDSAAGYSYGQNMGFVVAMMLLAGFIYGVGYYFLVNHVAPGFGETMAEASAQAAVVMYGDQGEAMLGMLDTMMANPFFWIFYGVTAMIIYGGLIGLFVSAFVKRRPDIFANNTPRNE